MDFKINLDLSQVIHITAPENDNDVVSISSKTYVFDNDANISLIIQKTPGASQTIRQLTVGNGLEVHDGALQMRFEGGKLQNGRYYYEAFDLTLGKRIFRGWLHLLPSAYHFAVSHEENAFNGGKSAYQHWLDAGNTGQLADFLEAIKGEKGDVLDHKWQDTSLSLQKPDGTFGSFVDLIGKPFVFSDFTPEQRESLRFKFSHLSQDEKLSIKGEKGDKPNIQWNGTQLRIQNPDDTWSSYVDLIGAIGKSNYDLWLENGNTGTLTEFLESLKVKPIVLTNDEYLALNGDFEVDVPYYITD